MKWVLLLCFVTCACAASRGQQTYSLEDAEALFEKFIVDYNRHYADEHEKQMRFKLFKQNLIKVNALNDKQGGNKVFGINKFSDFTVQEKKKLKGLILSDDSLCKTNKTDADIPDAGAPNSWDWRDKKVVSEVKNQGYVCGSCYAFSAVGNIEGQYALKHNQLMSLSVQQILDCSDSTHRTNGCEGGWMSGAFRYVLEQGGIEKDSDYSYIEKKTQCVFDNSKVVVKVTDCFDIYLKSQEKLKQLLYKNGPISVAIDSTRLLLYTKGVVKDCQLNSLDHGVLLVGYGTDPIDGDYWLLKNSWGADWGEDGYFRIERGEEKISCGMLTDGMATSVVE